MVNITDIGSDGEGIGKEEGFTWFVPGALPGDQVDIHTQRKEKRYGYATIRNLIVPSPDRVEPPCPFFGTCGGCQLQHLSYEAQLLWKQKKIKDAFARLAKIDGVEVRLVMGMTSPWHYRNKSQFPIGKDNLGHAKMGFYAIKSHRLIDITQCSIQDPVIESLWSELRAFIQSSGITVYDETSHRGELRHVMVRVNHRQEASLVFVTTKAAFNWKLPVFSVPITGVMHNENARITNRIFDKNSTLISGVEWIEVQLLTWRYRFFALSFFQVNIQQTEVLIQTVLEALNLTKEDVVLDLYCGVGTFSLPLACKAKQVFALENNLKSVEYARINATLNGISNATFTCADAKEGSFYEGIDANVVVLDPPRKGCEPEVLAQIKKIAPDKIVYVSCDVATLARDCAILQTYGYHVVFVQPVDMFAHTTHIEMVTLLRRQQD